MSTEGNRDKSTEKSKKSDEIDPNVLLEAVKSILIGKKGIRTAAREYNIPKSTLDRYKLKIAAEFEDLSSISDEILLKFIRVSHRIYATFCIARPTVYRSSCVVNFG